MGQIKPASAMPTHAIGIQPLKIEHRSFRRAEFMAA
jgi:hypothetical protein